MHPKLLEQMRDLLQVKHSSERWTPTCAGVTTQLTVIPAQAGTHVSATWSHFQNF